MYNIGLLDGHMGSCYVLRGGINLVCWLALTDHHNYLSASTIHYLTSSVRRQPWIFNSSSTGAHNLTIVQTIITIYYQQLSVLVFLCEILLLCGTLNLSSFPSCSLASVFVLNVLYCCYVWNTLVATGYAFWYYPVILTIRYTVFK